MLDSMHWLRLGGLAVIVGIVAPEALSEPTLVSESQHALRWGLRLGSALALGLFACCFWIATRPRTMALRSASALVAAQAIAALAISPELMLVLAAELPLIFGERRARGWLVGLALLLGLMFAGLLVMKASGQLVTPLDAPSILSEALTSLIWLGFAYVCGAMAAEQSRQRVEVETLNTQLRATSAELAEHSRQEERLAIARELHDSVGHTLTAQIVQLEITRQLVEPGRVLHNVTCSLNLARNALTQAREAAHTLRQPRLADLSAGLQELKQSAIGIDVRLELPASLPALAPVQAHALYRCAQESMTNAVRHSGARQMVLTACEHDGGVMLCVSDGGAGRANVVPGNGLTGLRERLESLQGRLTIDTDTGRGFTLTAWLPLCGVPVSDR